MQNTNGFIIDPEGVADPGHAAGLKRIVAVSHDADQPVAVCTGVRDNLVCEPRNEDHSSIQFPGQFEVRFGIARRALNDGRIVARS